MCAQTSANQRQDCSKSYARNFKKDYQRLHFKMAEADEGEEVDYYAVLNVRKEVNTVLFKWLKP